MKIADADTESAVRKFMARIPVDLPVERVLLYGSRARGDFRPDSDADVAVILRHGADDWKLLWTLTGLAYDVFVDTIEVARLSLESEDPRSAVDRAYYAMLCISRAAQLNRIARLGRLPVLSPLRGHSVRVGTWDQ